VWNLTNGSKFVFAYQNQTAGIYRLPTETRRRFSEHPVVPGTYFFFIARGYSKKTTMGARVSPLGLCLTCHGWSAPLDLIRNSIMVFTVSLIIKECVRMFEVRVKLACPFAEPDHVTITLSYLFIYFYYIIYLHQKEFIYFGHSYVFLHS